MGTMKIRNLAIFLLLAPLLSGAVRLKDIAVVENARSEHLVGYGLVVGLNGTGDRSTGSRGTVFTVQTISNMLERFGITVPKEQLRTRNVAAVMVTGRTPAFGRRGSQFDVTVSSLGDATSLEGGILLMTPLLGSDGAYYAQSQGPVSIGGYNIETIGGEKLRKNHALVGRVPNGGILVTDLPGQIFDLKQPIRLLLHDPDFVTATRIAEEINLVYGGLSVGKSGLLAVGNIARPVSAGVVELTLPDTITTQEEAVFFIAGVETLSVEPDMEARVVLNERTGTIVAGGNVVIQEVMISHGSLTIHTTQRPVISQPQAPFSSAGQTVVVPVTNTEATEAEAQTAVIGTTTTVADLARALNELGLKPRDIIAIFQSIKQAGALKAKLIII
jgi:flagellar P-ring protein precursor FlgI